MSHVAVNTHPFGEFATLDEKAHDVLWAALRSYGASRSDERNSADVRAEGEIAYAMADLIRGDGTATVTIQVVIDENGEQA